jgi:type II secretion system protein G
MFYCLGVFSFLLFFIVEICPSILLCLNGSMGISKRAGFTIVELLIVVVVIGILAAITIVAYNGVTEQARISQANSELASFKKAMLAYKAVYGELPPIGDSWNYNTDPPDCTRLGYVIDALSAEGYKGLSPQDPWGNCWGYDDNDCNTSSAAGATTRIKSVGPDSVNGNADDISLLVSTKEAAGC